MKNKVLILSGGLDSTVLLYDSYVKYGNNLHTLTYDYGQKHMKEIDCAFKISKKLNIHNRILDVTFIKSIARSALTSSDIDVPNIKDVLGDPQPVSYVPNRNMMLLSIAASYAESINADEVIYGAQAHDTFSGYWDASPEFLTAINNVLNLNRRNKIQITAPFINMNKTDIVKLGQKLNVDYSDTWTCYNGREKACGTCPTCANRLKAFIDAKIKDPIEYEVNIDWSKYGI